MYVVHICECKCVTAVLDYYFELKRAFGIDYNATSSTYKYSLPQVEYHCVITNKSIYLFFYV